MKGIARLVIAYACLVVAGCSQQALFDKFTPHPEAEQAKQVLDAVRDRQFDAVKGHLAANLLAVSDIDTKLTEVADYFPEGAPVSVKLVGARTFSINGHTTYDLTYEYQFSKGWALGNVHMNKQGDAALVDGIHVQRMTQSLEQTNAFALGSKGFAHWLMLTLTVLLPLFCLYAFVLCLRTPIAKRKWLWAVFTLLGVVTLHFNWTTGAFGLQLLYVQLFGAGWSQLIYGPIMLGVSFPLGAVWFLYRRKSLMQATAAPESEPGAAAAT
ncbi:hypothetical protein [Dyella silvae]|uniref:hypothetical protein n=1 Tax=Dyella silvae TaxID=2994424 RepID=UPI002263F47C|nr:hypothetical protein [Dyella silvae]